MHFHKALHPHRGSKTAQLFQLVHGERRGNQEHGVRSERARLVDLIRIDDKILAQHGHRDNLLDLFDEGRAALKKILFGDDGDRLHAGFFINPCYAALVKILLDEPAGRACLLDLSDKGELARPIDRLGQRQRPRHAAGRFFERVGADGGCRLRDALFLLREYVF